jgi:transcriptional regulator with XRE-family HTH domain
MNADIGGRVRELRLTYGLTVEQLAEILEISPGFLGLIERGRRGLAIPRIIKLSVVFRVTIDYLLVGRGEEPPCRDEDLISNFMQGFNEHELKALTEVGKNISAYGYSKGEIDLLSEAVCFQIVFMNKLLGTKNTNEAQPV